MVHFTPYFTVPGCGYSAKSLPIGTNLYTCLSPLCCVVHFGAVLIIRPHLVTHTTWAVFTMLAPYLGFLGPLYLASPSFCSTAPLTSMRHVLVLSFHTALYALLGSGAAPLTSGRHVYAVEDYSVLLWLTYN